MPTYRSSKLNKPVSDISWNETKTFQVFRFTVFPLIRLLTIPVFLLWILFTAVVWLPSMLTAWIPGWVIFGDPSKFYNYKDPYVTAFRVGLLYELWHNSSARNKFFNED